MKNSIKKVLKNKVVLIFIVIILAYNLFVASGRYLMRYKAITYVYKNYDISNIERIETAYSPIMSWYKGWDLPWRVYIYYKEKPKNAMGKEEYYGAKNAFDIYEIIELTMYNNY